MDINKINVKGKEYSLSGGNEKETVFEFEPEYYLQETDTGYLQAVAFDLSFINLDVSKPFRINLYRTEEDRKNEIEKQNDSLFATLYFWADNYGGINVTAYSFYEDSAFNISGYFDLLTIHKFYDEIYLAFTFDIQFDQNIIEEILGGLGNYCKFASVHYFKDTYASPKIMVEI